MGGCIGTMFQTGKAIGNIMYKGFSDAVINGVLECKELWSEKMLGNLTPEDEDDVLDEDVDEEDTCDVENSGQ